MFKTGIVHDPGSVAGFARARVQVEGQVQRAASQVLAYSSAFLSARDAGKSFHHLRSRFDRNFIGHLRPPSEWKYSCKHYRITVKRLIFPIIDTPNIPVPS